MKKVGFISTMLLAVLLWLTGCFMNREWADVVEPSNIFSNNMVLQREKPINIWGMASPNCRVKVLFNGQEKSIVSKDDSTWVVVLDPETAGGPFDLLIVGKDTIQYSNVMVGEVWVCSGQSNMQMEMGNSGRVHNYLQEIAEANYPDIRIRTVPHRTELLPQDNLDEGKWKICSPQTIQDFSATAYFFGRKLYQELKVPIGLVHASSGGTPVEAWTSTEFIQKAADIKPMVAYADRNADNIQIVSDIYNKKMTGWNEAFHETLLAIEQNLPDMALLGYQDANWATIRLPQPWEEVEGGLGYTDGVVWFRKKLVVERKSADKESFELSLGYIHDENETFINGVPIGKKETRWGSEITKYTVPKGIIKPGENIIAVKITNYDWIGGICRDEDSLWIRYEDGTKINLSGAWKYKMIFNFDDFREPPVSPADSHEPAVLYNGMINPLTSMAIRGCIWYQGEDNANRPVQYGRLFPLLIESWRAKWNQGDFPFYFVQLANFMEKQQEPGKSNWAALRESQSAALAMPNTGQAVAIDIGEADNIHPKNKQDVGLRLALNALSQTYGRDIEYSGPVFDSMKVIGDTIIVSFVHTGSGLLLKDPDKLKAFAIAGIDKKFIWAEVKIANDDLYIWSKDVHQPVAVRYGWANNPDCNLYNKEGLPAAPFRTDKWELELE